MNLRKGLIGAAALAAFGCGDDDVSQYNDADIDASDDSVSETAAFSFEGEAVYCSHVTEDPIRVTCLDIYADMNIEADNKITSVYSNILCDDRNRQNAEQEADSNDFLYQTHLSLCLRDVIVTGVDLVAEDVEGNQGIYSMPEDCNRIEELFGAQ